MGEFLYDWGFAYSHFAKEDDFVLDIAEVGGLLAIVHDFWGL